MSTQVFFAVLAVGLAVILLTVWRTGRAIFLESVLHPLREAVLVFQEGKATIVDLTNKYEVSLTPKMSEGNHKGEEVNFEKTPRQAAVR